MYFKHRRFDFWYTWHLHTDADSSGIFPVFVKTLKSLLWNGSYGSTWNFMGVAHLYVTGTNVKVSWILFPQFLCQILKRIFLSVSLWKKQIVKKRSQTRDEGKHYLIDRFSGLINSKSTCHLPRAPSFHLIIWRRSLKTLTFIDSHSW